MVQEVFGAQPAVWDTYSVTERAFSTTRGVRCLATCGAAVVLLFAASAPARAVRPTGTATRAVVPMRTVRRIAWDRVPVMRKAAWSHFVSDAGEPGWRALWDRATRVPVRIFGPGIDAPGTVAEATTAASFSREFLARHLDLLAPGAAAADFSLVTNDLSDGVRTVGFLQYHHGLRVIGGQVSFRFKADRLVVIASEALPDVRATPVARTPAGCPGRASTWLRAANLHVTRASAASPPMILPVVTDAGVAGYRTVVGVNVSTASPIGRWQVYLDAQSREPVARIQTLRYGTAAIYYNAPIRYPGSSRNDFPATKATIDLGDGQLTTDAAGILTWDGTDTVDVDLKTVGPLVAVANAAGDPASLKTLIPDNGSAVWQAATDSNVDAQLATFIHVQIGKDYARRFAPDLAWLDTQIVANVNLSQTCNAFFDGESLNFFAASDDCQNTGRIADVVYHELGHGVHANSILEGVGVFDGALSEGLSDYFAADITKDPGMGRGFFFSNEPLRQIDPEDGEHRWPEDIGEIHTTGMIISGALWDLRKLLIAKYGEEQGIVLTDSLLHAIMQRAADIPTSYVEALVADDDDGDLANGSPDVCEIDQAFGDHGLRDLGTDVSAPSVAAPNPDGFPVALTVSGLREECPGDTISGVTLSWNLRRNPDQGGTINMTASGDSYMANLPPAPEGTVLRYRIDLSLEGGGHFVLPENPADPSYELFVGEVKTLYCTDFEEDPFAAGWTHGLSSQDMTMGGDDWKWGAPVASAASGDPSAARSGTSVIGNDLSVGDMDGFYQPNVINFAQSPVVDVDSYSDVRLQYWRWLNVEDGYYDHATIYANGEKAWENANSMQGDSSSTHHRDHEWRFHDVPLSTHIKDGTVQVKYEIASDGGLELGGWTIDDFCIVAVPSSICGDGQVSGAEECDDGSANSNGNADACRKNCRVATCGDQVVDSDESCDDGNLIEDDGCSNECVAPGADSGGCGCQTPGAREHDHRGRKAALVLFALAATVVIVRRRRA